jgi:hypothetical protein
MLLLLLLLLVVIWLYMGLLTVTTSSRVGGMHAAQETP